MSMNTDLEAIVSADEEARARVDAARAASDAQVQAAVDARSRRRHERYEALRQTADAEERGINETADLAVANRRASRASYLAARRLATESALARAGELYARIICSGPQPGTSS
jgi:hypothetical protein